MSDSAHASSDACCNSSWKFESSFAQRFYSCVGSPLSVAQNLHVASGDYQGANSVRCNPDYYQEPERFAEDYQVAELLKKSVSIPGYTDVQRDSAALSKFLACEVTNAQTNTRLMNEAQPSWFGDYSYHFLHVLGDLDTTALGRVADLAKFGPGTNVGVAGDGLVPSIKYDTNPVCTEGLLPLLRGVMPELVVDFWGDNLLEKTKVVPGNAHFTVPKAWDVNRCAAKEPLWNSWLQGGIGRYIEKRLIRFGVDLHNQGLNQSLAEHAHRFDLATIDLSSASDMMSRVLVWLSLCYNGCEQGKRWFHLLDSARSKSMRLPDKTEIALEMFASMGNAFTFPLETAIFLAVCRSVVPRGSWWLMTAYGDDIIVPQRYAIEVIERLEYLGFKVNSKKTCLAGTFFESCGTDWFQGQNVRPFYLSRDPGSQVPYPLQAANALRAWCLRIYGYLPERYASLWRWCKGQVPFDWRYPVPAILGDTGLHVGISDAIRSGVKLASGNPGCEYHQWEGYLVKHVKVVSIQRDRRSFGVLCGALRQLEGDIETASKGLEPVRGLFGRPRTEKSVVLWEDDLRWGGCAA